jgi:hypothetical protein
MINLSSQLRLPPTSGTWTDDPKFIYGAASTAGGAGVRTDRGEVDDHGDVLVATPGVTLYLGHMSGAGAIIGLGTRAVPQRRAERWRRRSRGVLE